MLRRIIKGTGTFRNGLILKYLPVLLGFACCVAPSVGAWGPQAHRIVAEIAQINLEPGIKARIAKDFNIIKLSNISVWADKIRDERTGEKPWHYTNIAKGKKYYDRKRDCPRGNCVTEKIFQFETTLRDEKKSSDKRRDALKYLVHFVADVHQPLHLGNKEDRGGNEIKVTHDYKETKLHALWDSGLIFLNKGQSLPGYARKLNRQISPADIRKWSAGTAREWSDESRFLALKYAYPMELTALKQLKFEYVDQAHQVVKMQLSKAGIRLADLLNRALKPQAQERSP